MPGLRERLFFTLINKLPHVTVQQAANPREIDAALPEEERLLDRRCRCGAMATEIDRACHWHDATSAQYAATLLAVLKAADAVAPGTIVHAARIAADDAELAAQPWFRDGLRAYAEGRTQKA